MTARDWDYGRTAPDTVPSLPPLRPTAGRTGTVAGSLLAFSLVGGAAFAVWTATGTGTGGATATSLQTVTVTPGVAGAQLYPGLTADGTSTGADLALSFTNPNPFPVTVTVSNSAAATTTTAAGCTGSTVTLRSGFSNATVLLKASTLSKVVPFAVSMASAAKTGCQSATFSVALSTSSTAG